MKILFFGDSITDANRERETDFSLKSYGFGYVRAIAGELLFDDPTKYEIFNRGMIEAVERNGNVQNESGDNRGLIIAQCQQHLFFIGGKHL